MNHIEWKQSNPCLPGPVTHYGYWEGAKCFSVYYDSLAIKALDAQKHTTPSYKIKSALPGFRQDLPPQKSVAEAQAFAERMLQRWAAKRGLIFKSHIIVTDAMKEAAQKAAPWSGGYPAIDDEAMERIIKAALEARG